MLLSLKKSSIIFPYRPPAPPPKRKTTLFIPIFYLKLNLSGVSSFFLVCLDSSVLSKVSSSSSSINQNIPPLLCVGTSSHLRFLFQYQDPDPPSVSLVIRSYYHLVWGWTEFENWASFEVFFSLNVKFEAALAALRWSRWRFWWHPAKSEQVGTKGADLVIGSSALIYLLYWVE